MSRKKLFREKSILVTAGSDLCYKFRSLALYRCGTIADATDSTIVFTSGAMMKWQELKSIRIDKANYVNVSFRKFFTRLGLLFFPLNTANQLITGHRPVFSPLAAAVSAGLITTGFLIREIGLRRIRAGKKLQVHVVKRNYENLNSGDH